MISGVNKRPAFVIGFRRRFRLNGSGQIHIQGLPIEFQKKNRLCSIDFLFRYIASCEQFKQRDKFKIFTEASAFARWQGTRRCSVRPSPITNKCRDRFASYHPNDLSQRFLHLYLSLNGRIEPRLPSLTYYFTPVLLAAFSLAAPFLLCSLSQTNSFHKEKKLHN